MAALKCWNADLRCGRGRSGLRSSEMEVRNLRGRPSEMVWIVLAWPLGFQRSASCFLQLPAVPPAVGERIGLGRKRWNRPSVRPIRTEMRPQAATLPADVLYRIGQRVLRRELNR